jgi:hypothetical protein
MLPHCNILSYMLAIYHCSMEITLKKNAVHLALLSVGIGILFIASLASPTHLDLATLVSGKARSRCVLTTGN